MERGIFGSSRVLRGEVLNATPRKSNVKVAGTKKWEAEARRYANLKTHHSDASWFSVINSVIKNSTHTPNLRREKTTSPFGSACFIGKKKMP